MKQLYIDNIAKLLSISKIQVERTISLISEGATVPFISRYRKEMTGSLDEVQIMQIKEELAKLQEIDKRREAIIKSIDEQEKLTDELSAKLNAATSLTELEDLYLPYKQKRKTRGTKAKEKGLEPLAKIIMKQQETDIEFKAEEFLSDEVETIEDALQGARDIVAEWVNESQLARNRIRRIYKNEAIISTKLVKGKEEEGQKYSDYFEWTELLKSCPSHRFLAMRRGETEGFLRLSIDIEKDKALDTLHNIFVKGKSRISEQVTSAISDSFKRLISPSMETEFKSLSKEKADEKAIMVFADNMRQLLLSSPLGQKRVLAIDPGYRSGCKVVCLDAQGNLLYNENIYPHKPQEERKQASKKIISMIDAYKIDAIAIGNGTASRETESFVRNLKFKEDIQVFVVSEDGASVYSASKVAREEFPQYDVTVRGAVSIGRRLMDPLAELVKIDPKAIGVGQYQHDVDQTKLKDKLDQVVESCVNLVGVNVNTASKHLLTYVAGLGPQLAQNIVDYRKENGPLKNRREIKKIKRMGEKAFQQCGGFLRIDNSNNPLDNSAVHPESYCIVEKMAKDNSCKVIDLIKNESIRKSIKLEQYASEKIGMPTLNDIMNELAKPGRDPRTKIKVFEFDKNLYSINDIRIGMEVPGIITNITNFGAFVDIGIKQDGLVHISNMADRYISDPGEVVSLHQHVKVRIIDLDIPRKRIQLSMKDI